LRERATKSKNTLKDAPTCGELAPMPHVCNQTYKIGRYHPGIKIPEKLGKNVNLNHFTGAAGDCENPPGSLTRLERTGEEQ
jgi:hypothetical protein